MSDVISGWIDKAELRRLADSLVTKAAPKADLIEEVDGFGSQFEGFAEEIDFRPTGGVEQILRGSAPGVEPASIAQEQSIPLEDVQNEVTPSSPFSTVQSLQSEEPVSAEPAENPMGVVQSWKGSPTEEISTIQESPVSSHSSDVLPELAPELLMAASESTSSVGQYFSLSEVPEQKPQLPHVTTFPVGNIDEIEPLVSEQPPAVTHLTGPVVVKQEPQAGELAVAAASEEIEETATKTSPSVVRSAVDFLKKAKQEGVAGGALRQSPSLEQGEELKANVPPVHLPKKGAASGVQVGTGEEKIEKSSELLPPEPLSPSSPFRRLSNAELTAKRGITGSPALGQGVVTPSMGLKDSQGHFNRPARPSGDEPILNRVKTFGRWLKGPVGAQNFFVCNSEGKILIDEVENPKLIQVARSLVSASNGGSKTEVPTESLHVRIGEDSLLEVVPTPSQFGILILGLIVDYPLPDYLVNEIRRGLEEVANARLLAR